MDATKFRELTDDQRERLKELQTIRRALVGMRIGGRGPDTWKGVLPGAAISLTGLLIGGWAILPGIALGAIAGVWINNKGRTWRLFVYDALARYQPVNGQAYRDLQVTVKERGFDADAVMEWTRKEQAAITPPLLTKDDLARDKFLSATHEIAD